MKKLAYLKGCFKETDDNKFSDYINSIRDNFPKRYQNVDPDMLSDDICSYCYDTKPADRNGLYLFGKSGTGKTHIAYTVALIARANRIKTRVVNANELLNEIQQSFNSPRQYDVTGLNEVSDFLVIDDLGAHNISQWSSNLFYLLINGRYEAMQPTLFTSNHSLDEISQLFGDRITSRIAEMCRVIELSGEDKRLQ